MTATPMPEPVVASVIVPCFNQLEYTRHCVASLCRHTGAPSELVVVDNGSSDGTGTYLQGVNLTGKKEINKYIEAIEQAQKLANCRHYGSK